MKPSSKKDAIIIFSVLIGVVVFGLLSSNSHQRLVNVYPDKLALLNSEDFTLGNTAEPIIIGKSTGSEVKKLYPKGKMLGMSAVYRPTGQDTIFTFTNKSDILTKVDITGPGITTSRGIEVNNQFSEVVKIYGKGYVKSYLKKDPNTFDAIYGSKQYIVFHVENGIVKRIVIDSRV